MPKSGPATAKDDWRYRGIVAALLLAAALSIAAGHRADQAGAASPEMSRAPPVVLRIADDADRQRATALDRKFAALQAATNEAEATPLIAEIWSLWHTSGHPEVDDLMSKILSLAIFGQGAEAEALIDEVIHLKPDFPEGWNQRATLRYHQGRYAESLADCVEVLKREPRHFGALSGMGLIALAQGDEKGALAAFRRARAVNPFLAQRDLIPLLERKLEGRPL